MQYYGNNDNGNLYDFDDRIVSVVTTAELVTISEAKIYLDVSHDTDDAQITNAISTAIARVETFINRDIISRVRETFYQYSPVEFKLLQAPINRDEDITITLDGVANTNFEVLGLDDPTIRLNEGGYGEAVGGGDKLIVRYTTQALDPLEVKQAILCCVAELYYQRNAVMNTNWKAYASHLKQTFI